MLDFNLPLAATNVSFGFAIFQDVEIVPFLTLLDDYFSSVDALRSQHVRELAKLVLRQVFQDLHSCQKPFVLLHLRCLRIGQHHPERFAVQRPEFRVRCGTHGGSAIGIVHQSQLAEHVTWTIFADLARRRVSSLNEDIETTLLNDVKVVSVFSLRDDVAARRSFTREHRVYHRVHLLSFEVTEEHAQLFAAPDVVLQPLTCLWGFLVVWRLPVVHLFFRHALRTDSSSPGSILHPPDLGLLLGLLGCQASLVNDGFNKRTRCKKRRRW
mmetsp:Transcript_14410/g.39356  ORF Transcript_14410/g.39356 Transcript_14410/m.39356 type:complete len:269 (-) Transcript_14410:296-1102(-)